MKEPCPCCGATGRLRIKEIKRPPEQKPPAKVEVDDEADDDEPAPKK